MVIEHTLEVLSSWPGLVLSGVLVSSWTWYLLEQERKAGNDWWNEEPERAAVTGAPGGAGQQPTSAQAATRPASGPHPARRPRHHKTVPPAGRSEQRSVQATASPAFQVLTHQSPWLEPGTQVELVSLSF
eukprot:g59470.t1